MYANLLAKSWDAAQSVTPPTHARLLPHLRAAAASADAIYESVGIVVLANLGLDAATWGARLRSAMSLAALTHDLGKANDYFQGMVRGEGRFPATAQPIRHDLVSVLLLLRNTTGVADWLRGQLAEGNDAEVTTALFRSVIGAIAGHHLKMDMQWSKGLRLGSGGGSRLEILLDHPELRPLFGGSAGAANESWPLLPSHPASPSKMSRVFRREHLDWLDFLVEHKDWRRFAGALKALVMAADVAASAILPERVSPRRWIKDALANRLDREQALAVVKERLQGRQPRPFQQAIADTVERVTLVEAGCGTGKTAGAYLWAARNAADRKLFFCYPTTGTATEGYLGYVHDSDVEAALVHSRAAVDLEGIATSTEDPGEEEALRIQSLKLWRPPAIICTIDTVLALARNNRKGLYGSPAILSGAFVFDELHAYDDSMFEAVVALILALPGAPFLLMSASLPAARKEFLERHIGAIGQVPRPADLEEIPRYRFAHAPIAEDAFDAAVTAVDRGQRVLWVCNTVARAQTIFDRAARTGLPATAYHSRFRYHDRVERHREVVQAFADQASDGRLAVTTQVAEMSLDLDAHLLVTELAPVPALIQRLGRLNRRVSTSNRGEPRTALFLEPEDSLPYQSELLTSARTWLDTLIRLNRPLSQHDLATCFEAMEATQPSGLDLRCEWLDSGWCAMPGPIRELSPSVTLILPEDADACRANSMELTRRSLPMPYSRRMENWSRYKSALLAPPDTIGYDARRGAEWAS